MNRKKNPQSISSALAWLLLLSSIAVCYVFFSLISGNSKPKNRPIHQELSTISIRNSANPFMEPLVSIVFDRGLESTYLNALPILQSQQFPSTFYIVAGDIDYQPFISTDQLRNIYELGHEVGSMSMSFTNTSLIDEDTLRKQNYQSQLLLERVTQNPVLDFAAPYGDYSANSVNIIREQYRSHRTKDTKINLASNSSFNNIGGYTLNSNTRADDVQTLLDKTIESQGWLVLIYEDVSYDRNSNSVTPEQLYAHLNLIKNSDIKVTTLGTVIEALQQRYTPL